MENKQEVINHLYVISSVTGQSLIYSTVDSKVSSSSKKISPKTVVASARGTPINYSGIVTYINKINKCFK